MSVESTKVPIVDLDAQARPTATCQGHRARGRWGQAGTAPTRYLERAPPVLAAGQETSPDAATGSSTEEANPAHSPAEPLEARGTCGRADETPQQLGQAGSIEASVAIKPPRKRANKQPKQPGPKSLDGKLRPQSNVPGEPRMVPVDQPGCPPHRAGVPGDVRGGPRCDQGKHQEVRGDRAPPALPGASRRRPKPPGNCPGAGPDRDPCAGMSRRVFDQRAGRCPQFRPAALNCVAAPWLRWTYSPIL